MKTLKPICCLISHMKVICWRRQRSLNLHTWRIWEYCSKASLKDSQQSNVVPTLKRCSSISSNCTDHLRHNNKMYLKKHIRLRQFVPPQRKPQRIPRHGGLLPMRKRALCCDWLIAALRIASRCHISLFVEQLCE